MTTTTRTAIRQLRTEAATAGDDTMVAMCDRAMEHRLLDSDTGEPVEAEDVGGSVAYCEAVVDSLDMCPQPEGHVRAASGRRVYAE